MLRTLLLLPLLLSAGCIIAVDVPHDQWDDSGIHVTHVRHHHRDGGEVSGRVVDASGAPAAAKVIAVYPSGSYSQTSGPDGSFVLGPLPAGEVNLKAATADGRVALLAGIGLERDGDVRNVELRLEQGATIDVSYEGDQESLRCALFHEGLRVADFTLRPGEHTTVAVPAGRVPLQLYRGGAVHAAREVRVSPGETAEVVFQLD